MHHLRVSLTKRKEIIDDALGYFIEMKDHLNGCSACVGANALVCDAGLEIQSRFNHIQQTLKLIGFELEEYKNDS